MSGYTICRRSFPRNSHRQSTGPAPNHIPPQVGQCQLVHHPYRQGFMMAASMLSGRCRQQLLSLDHFTSG
jgi:hypothetical protein